MAPPIPWRFVGSSIEGDAFEIASGVPVWPPLWRGPMGGPVTVADPRYGTLRTLDVWEIDTAAGPIRFAAGEFSANIWGFYRPAEDAP